MQEQFINVFCSVIILVFYLTRVNLVLDCLNTSKRQLHYHPRLYHLVKCMLNPLMHLDLYMLLYLVMGKYQPIEFQSGIDTNSCYSLFYWVQW